MRVSKKPLTLREIVLKLVGNITPIGETNADNNSFENLQQLTQLVDELLSDIDNIAYIYKNSHEFSVQRAAKFCSDFYDKLGIEK